MLTTKTTSPAVFAVWSFGHNSHSPNLHSSSIEVLTHTTQANLKNVVSAKEANHKSPLYLLLCNSIYVTCPE